MKPEQVDAMSLQQAMDFAVKKIVEQGKRCTDADDDGCVYGDSAGNHCAVGWLLDENNPELMGYAGGVEGLCTLAHSHKQQIPDLLFNNAGAFETLQGFHDVVNKTRRVDYMNLLKDTYGIDISGAHWQQWVELGEKP